MNKKWYNHWDKETLGFKFKRLLSEIKFAIFALAYWLLNVMLFFYESVHWVHVWYSFFLKNKSEIRTYEILLWSILRRLKGLRHDGWA